MSNDIIGGEGRRNLATKKEVMDYYGIKKTKLRSMVKSGELPAIYFGKSVRFDWEDVIRLKDSKKSKPKTDAGAAPMQGDEPGISTAPTQEQSEAASEKPVNGKVKKKDRGADKDAA